MKIHTFFCCILAFCLWSSCGQQAEKYVEITSALPGTKVYLDGKYMGDAPLRLSEGRLKELGLAYPYSIRNGDHLWEAWDIADTSGAITVQNDPKSAIAGKFRFQAILNDPGYKSVEEEGSSWLLFQLKFAPIGSLDHERGRRLTAIPIKVEQGAADR
jgi:hypothetical protein